MKKLFIVILVLVSVSIVFSETATKDMNVHTVLSGIAYNKEKTVSAPAVRISGPEGGDADADAVHDECTLDLYYWDQIVEGQYPCWNVPGYTHKHVMSGNVVCKTDTECIFYYRLDIRAFTFIEHVGYITALFVIHLIDNYDQ